MANYCHVLQSLTFMMLGHMGETHTDGIPVQFMIFFAKSAHECYNFVFKVVIDHVMMCIRKCHIF